MRIISIAYAMVGFVLFSAVTSVFAESGIIYRNPRVYNVEYSFELSPDPSFYLGQASYIIFDGSRELARGH